MSALPPGPTLMDRKLADATDQLVRLAQDLAGLAKCLRLTENQLYVLECNTVENGTLLYKELQIIQATIRQALEDHTPQPNRPLPKGQTTPENRDAQTLDPA